MSSPEEIGESQPIIELDNGIYIYIGDSVVIVRISRPTEDPARFANPDRFQAFFSGIDIVTEDGEVLFDGEPKIHFTLTLEDGTTERIWEHECKWTDPETYQEAAARFNWYQSAPYN